MLHKRLMHLINTPLSPDKLDTIMMNSVQSKTKILDIETVTPSMTVDDLFSNGDDGTSFDDVVLYSPVRNLYNGHFQAMFRNKAKNTIYFFDSYGHTLKFLFDLVKLQYNRTDNNTIYKILANSGYKLMMNTFEYQSDTAADCGRYSTSLLFFRRMFLNDKNNSNDFDFNTYYQLLTRYKEKQNLDSYDEAVTLLTQKFLQ